MLGLSGERMTKVDTAWLRMDSPSNLMMIVGVWTLKPGIKYADLCQRVQERLLKYNRFRQKVVEDAAGATWVEDRNFDMPTTSRARSCRATPGARPSRRCKSAWASWPCSRWTRSHPLWHFSLIEDYEGGSAMLVRIHHCIADGIALISVTMSLVDGGAPPPERRRREAPHGAEDWIADTLIKPLTDITVKALGAAGDGVAGSLHMLRDPQKGMAGSLDLARLAYQVLSDAAALALMPDDSHPPEGQARPRQARGLVRPLAAGRSQGRRQGAQLLGQRRVAQLRGRRHRRVPARWATM
jgi:diacylglycerol O-acyltransferase